MKVKATDSISIPELYDIHSLIDIDSMEDRVIINPDFDTPGKSFDASFAAAIESKIQNPESGKVYLIANEFLTVKYYALYIKHCGHSWVKPLYFTNMDTGIETVYALTQADYDFLKTYKIFSDDTELAFFMAAQEYGSNDYRLDYRQDNTDMPAVMGNMKPYLDNGLWIAELDLFKWIGADIKPSEVFMFVVADKIGAKHIEQFYKDNNMGNSNPYDVYNINGKNILTYKYGNKVFIVGPYESVKTIFCEFRDNTTFGGVLFYTPAITSPRFDDYIDYLASLEKPVSKAEQQAVKEEVKKELNEAASDKPADFWESQEKIFEQAKSEAKKKKDQKRKEKFSITSEVPQSEKESIKEAETTEPKPEEKVKLPARKSKRLSQIADALKTKEKIKTEVLTAYPTDWNKVLSIKETSARYNLTVGYRYDPSSGTPVMDETQTLGMTLEEWNAYFLAKPEVSHLIDDAIGSFGGIVFTEKDLTDSGNLLYNPRSKKLEYKHDYLRGNAYTLLEELETVKEQVIQVYGEQFYNKQVEIIEAAKPKEKLLTDPNPANVPFIHPLDEIVIDFKVNSAANMTFPKSVNRKIMRAYHQAQKSGTVSDLTDEELVIGQELQMLSITVFFRKWMETQYGKLASYGIPSKHLIDDMYFFGMTFKKFEMQAGHYNITLKKDEALTESDFYEMKDSVKRYVNDLFQEFLKNEVSEDDRKKIEWEWNKRYNGFISLDIWKHPIFIRHSKYLKDRSKGLVFELSRTQVEGIKFATVNNGSIIAHEVGYGKMQKMDANILTPTGWVKMRDIKKGDYVISVDGWPTKVNGVYPQGERDIYKIIFDDGASVECCDEHLWTVTDTTRKARGSDWITLTTKQMMDKESHIFVTRKDNGQKYKIKTYYKESHSGEKYNRNKWQIPVVKPVHFIKQELPIHPYLLGVLLGDGHISNSSIRLTSADQELLDRASLFLPDNKLKIKKCGAKKYDYIISNEGSKKGIKQDNKLLQACRLLGLTGKVANNKFIPDIYKFSSIEDRIWMLNGLLDTDGTSKITKRGTASQLSYTTVSETLKNDVVSLVQSLGGIATVYSRKPWYTYNGEKKQGQLAYTIGINLPPNIIPFTLSRKLSSHIPKSKYQPARFIDKIEYVGKAEGQCISVEHPSHLYVTKDFIVTHNTLVSINYMSHMFETNQANNVMVLVPKALYVNNKWKEEISGSYDEKRNKFLIGATPQYNLIEMGNFSTTTIFGEGKSEGQSKYKTYSDDDVDRIRRYSQLIVEIGGKQRGRQLGRKNPGTATLPATPYNFKQSVATSKSSWTKILDLLKTMDAPLLDRCKGKVGPEMVELIDFFAGFDIGTNAKERNERILTLQDKLNEISYKHQRWIPFMGPVPFKIDSDVMKNLDEFFRSEVRSYLYERDPKTGKEIIETDPDGRPHKVQRPHKDVAEEYVMSVLEDVHGWLNSVLEKMYDFGVYEYGTWNFSRERHNIILATRDSLVNLGFSEQSREGVTDVIKEITEYKHEYQYDSDEVEEVNFVDRDGVEKKWMRNPQKVLQKQLAELTNKISQNMTEEGRYGKFYLSNLNIDGMVLDEAHIGKKFFTNIKTSASTPLLLETGKEIKINTSSHDIKGGSTPNRALSVFALCQYIRSLGNDKPVMLLTATPFSNQPTEIFSMLSMVGIRQLREQGILNIKNFFDLFLKETLKYDFDHTGEFIKRIAVEDFRNKELLLNVIWSIIDIKREASLDAAQKNKDRKGAKPTRIVYPKLIADSSIEMAHDDDKEEDIGLRECETYGKVNTVAVVNRLAVNTCSIVDRNDVQKSMMDDIEKVIVGTPNPNNPVLDADGQPAFDAFKKPLYYPYTYDDICPNSELFAELEDTAKADDDGKKRKTKKELREEQELKIKVSKRDEYGKVFKGLGLSRAIALSPYLFRCNELPEPTPENLVKYSPKIEYLVKAIESVKNYHLNNIPKKVDQIKKDIEKLEGKGKLSAEEQKDLQALRQRLPHLEAAQEVSGQLVYINMLRFKYYSRDEKGKAQVKEYNIAELIKEYLIKKGVFEKDEIAIFSSDTSDERKEDYVKGFQDGSIKLFFGTPAMREGVDLQNKASTLYVMTPDWNPTDMRQIEGRIWRRDNENAYIRVVYVLLDQSIEVFIYAKLEEKARRLQQIMKERNTVAELEEMSLDPNQTKVALASDPTKRADIVTKLCEAVLIDRRNKISKTREELIKVTGELDKIFANVDVIKENYLKPYFEHYPGILKEYTDFRKKEIIGLYMNDRERFMRSFSKSFTGKLNDTLANTILEFFKEGFFEASTTRADMEYGNPMLRQLYFATNYKLEATHDILMGIKVILENKDDFRKRFTKEGSDKQNFDELVNYYNSIMPMRYATDSYDISGVNQYLFSSSFISQGGFIAAAGTSRVFSGITVAMLPAEAQDVILKAINKIFASNKTPARDWIVDTLLGHMGELQTILKNYILNNPEIRPELHKDYRRYTEMFDDFKIVSDKDFEDVDLFKKVAIINDMNITVRNQALSVFRTFPKDTQTEIVNGTYPRPTLAKIIPILGLDASLKKGEYDQLEELMRPFNDLRYVMKDIEDAYMKPRNMSIDDLPQLMDEINAEYKEINEKIDALKVSKEKLIERFQKIAEARKSVSVDAIVEKFSETNSFLEYKLS